ncbi:MAG: hypothetical protein O9253_00555, partial [Aquidulcibacter sp.]|nr:hypothetical protein [Aquidulcibacter sp.]
SQSRLQKPPPIQALSRNPHSHSPQHQRFVLRILSYAQEHPKPFTIAAGLLWVCVGRKPSKLLRLVQFGIAGHNH